MRRVVLSAIAIATMAGSLMAQNSVVKSLVLKSGNYSATLTAPAGLTQNMDFTIPVITGGGSLVGADNNGNVALGMGSYIQLTEPVSGGGTNYTRLVAGSQTNDWILTLPTDAPAAGEVLSVSSVAGSNVVLEWAAGGGGTVTHNATLTGNGTVGSPLGINLGNANTWTANQTFASTFLITANTRIALTNSDNNARDVRWQEPSGTGSQYIGWRAPSVSNNGNYVFPAVVGSVGQVLTIATSNGIDSATTSWTTVSGGGSSGLASFGYVYELATIADATVVGGADVPFSNNGPLDDVTHNAGTTTITVPAAATYKVDYKVSHTAGVGAALAIAVNGTVDASTNRTFLTAVGEVSGTAILTLAAGDVITMRNNSATPFTMTLAPGVGAQLTILRLN